MSKFKFEEAMTSLDQIVKNLESGEMGLDDSIKNFENAAKLYNQCKGYLGEAEKKVQILTDSLEEKNFE